MVEGSSMFAHLLAEWVSELTNPLRLLYWLNACAHDTPGRPLRYAEVNFS